MSEGRKYQLDKYHEAFDAMEAADNVTADEMKVTFLASIAESLAIIADCLHYKN